MGTSGRRRFIEDGKRLDQLGLRSSKARVDGREWRDGWRDPEQIRMPDADRRERPERLELPLVHLLSDTHPAGRGVGKQEDAPGRVVVTQARPVVPGTPANQ